MKTFAVVILCLAFVVVVAGAILLVPQTAYTMTRPCDRGYCQCYSSVQCGQYPFYYGNQSLNPEPQCNYYGQGMTCAQYCCQWVP